MAIVGFDNINNNKSEDNKHNAIEKAFAIMMSFLPNNDAISTIELSRNLGFHKATTSRILKIMNEFGMVTQNVTTKMYSLGPSIVKLSLAIHKSLNSGLISLARPFMIDLRKKTGQTVTLEILNGHNVMMGCVVEGDVAVRVAGQAGDSVCWNTTAGMRSIMAFSDDKFVNEMLSQPMMALTEYSIVEPEEFRIALKKVRQDGYAHEDGEVVVGFDALGAPVFGFDGKPLFAICLVGLSNQIKSNKSVFSEALKETVKEISKTFMYDGAS
ncbi:MAG: IclR family transcriptional regulator [Deltaproteobacteria bacterium]|jgi:DNA-binding IclR family transcriptional regulator|nr:IclR family transcriptional regulator [Deltaproteobacteria bacterium]